MYQAFYEEVLEDRQSSARRVEYQALDRCVHLLGKAAQAGAQPSREGVEALHWTRQLWEALVLELADDANMLATELRASLISIGLWILKEVDAIRLGRSANFAGIADICTIVRDGLR